MRRAARKSADRHVGPPCQRGASAPGPGRPTPVAATSATHRAPSKPADRHAGPPSKTGRGAPGPWLTGPGPGSPPRRAAEPERRERPWTRPNHARDRDEGGASRGSGVGRPPRRGGSEHPSTAEARGGATAPMQAPRRRAQRWPPSGPRATSAGARASPRPPAHVSAAGTRQGAQHFGSQLDTAPEYGEFGPVPQLLWLTHTQSLPSRTQP
jgi:hypothetical protein